MLDIIEELMEKLELPFTRFDGQTKVNERCVCDATSLVRRAIGPQAHVCTLLGLVYDLADKASSTCTTTTPRSLRSCSPPKQVRLR